MLGRISPVVSRWRGPILLSLIVTAFGIATSATAQESAPTADLAVTSLTANRTAAAPEAVVTFRERIRNNGPDTVEMDTPPPQIAGGVLVDVICQGVSSDGPFCEYGDLAPGETRVTRFKVKVTASHGRLIVNGGVFAEEPVVDDNPFNQYLTRSVRVASS
jgi:hypothetical protein